MRVVAQDVTVLEGSGLAFVGVAHHILRPGSLAGHEAPLEAGGEPRPAAAAQRRLLNLGDDRIGCHLLGNDLLQRAVAPARLVVLQLPVLPGDALHEDSLGTVDAGIEGRMCGIHFCNSASSVSIASGLMKLAILLLFTSTTGASPQAPKHSPCLSVKRPSGVVSFQSIPSFFFRCSAASTAPERAQGRFVHTHSLCLPTGARSYMP